MDHEGRLRIGYVLVDYFCTLAGVAVFLVSYCHMISEPGCDVMSLWQIMHFPSVPAIIAVYSLLMLLIYYLTGFYIHVGHKSHMDELAGTLKGIVAGVVLFCFATLMSGPAQIKSLDYRVIPLLGGILFFCVFMGRAALTSWILSNRYHKDIGRKEIADYDPHDECDCLAIPDSMIAIKRFMDIIISSVGLMVSVPVVAVLSCIIKVQSPGPVIYSQERIGFMRRPFRLFKLRSMIVDAEPDGPVLAVAGDRRITPIGRFMRKYHLDEIPNLWNVLKGDMSIVGPRPERQYYIERIIKLAPHYTLVHQVRPGLTSWGMVKYGYACDVAGMIERMKYDIQYLRNMSLSFDLRVIYHTLFTVIRGEGK